MPYMVFCTDDGMCLYNYSTYETNFYTYGNLPIQSATHLNAEKMLVILGDGSWSDGIYTFDIQTFKISGFLLKETTKYFIGLSLMKLL